MMTETPIAGPYAHAPVSIQRSMGLVMLALTPATLFGLYQFGWPAVALFLVTVVAALAFEAGALKVAGRPLRPALGDGSALLTGWLLALSLPPWAPWWIGVVGSLIAIVVAKQVFGGLGQNLFNPAMVARVALLISFPLEMTRFVAPHPIGSTRRPGPGRRARAHLRRPTPGRHDRGLDPGPCPHRTGPRAGPGPDPARDLPAPGLRPSGPSPEAWGRHRPCCCSSAVSTCWPTGSSPGRRQWPCSGPWPCWPP